MQPERRGQPLSDPPGVSLPQVPAIAASGIPGYVVDNWYGVMAPLGTPMEVITRLNAELVRILDSKEIRDRFTAEGSEVATNTPEQFGAFIRNEIQKWGLAGGEGSG